MSLLMEALRKAEEAKRKSQEEAPPPDEAPEIDATAHVRAAPLRSPFSLEPREPRPAPAPAPEPVAAAPAEQPAAPVVIASPRDELQDYLAADPVAEEAPAQQRSSRRQRSPRQSRDQLAAASVFAAKQGPKQDDRRKKRLALLLGFGFVTVISGGATLWYLQSMPGSGMAINPGIVNYDLASRGFIDEQAPVVVEGVADAAPATVVAEPVPAATPADASGGPEDSNADDIAAAAPGDAAPGDADATAELPPAAAPEQLADATPVVAPPAPLPAPAAPPATAGGVASDTEPRTLEIRRSSSRSMVNSSLQAAWSALQAGDLQTSALLYAEVLAEQPNDRDALIGQAAIQLHNGQTAEARQTYARLLTLDPQDPYARAGLLQASPGGNDPAQEAELKNLLQRYPELPPLHFALGNLYAGQQRWSEAQAAYFDALLHAGRDGSTPVSPDYAFNLAVSLEQLQQPEAALNYYRQALELSRSSPAGFDLTLLQSRLGFLQERTQE